MRARLSLRSVLAGALGTVVLAVIGAAGFIASGVYDIAAYRPHTEAVRTTLKFLQRRAIQRHAAGLPVPALEDSGLVRLGLLLYREHCVPCHGGPGEARHRIGAGLNPNPPPLDQGVERWTEAELYWTTAYGLKMAGMPSFLVGKNPRDLWAVVAFLRRMNRLTPREYRQLQRAAEGAGAGDVPWLAPTRPAALARIPGNPARGRRLLLELGCRGCHLIPGVRGPGRGIAAPLTGWSDRHYIGGLLVNTPENLVAWILDPRGVDSLTAMPAVGATRAQAEDVAAYLYTLGRKEWEPTGKRRLRNPAS